ASGKPLGRRIEGQGRVVIMLEHPDPEGQPHRRKLYAKKSNSLYPPALGVTMGDGGNQYDTSPPVAPVAGPVFQPERKSKVDVAAAWLGDFLAKAPQRVHIVRREAEDAGIQPGTLYRAKDRLRVEEFEDAEGKKLWQLPTPPEGSDKEV